MELASGWLRPITFILVGAPLFGCASAQLNYNTLDIASTIDSLVTSQVLSNLAKFLDSPNAIPSQIVIPNGTVQTNNTITSSAAIPVSLLSTATNTIATTAAAAASKTVTNTTTNTTNSATGTLSANDGWIQSWNLSPVTDPDQIRRLRILYQYATDQADDTDLLCNYPLISKKPDTSSQQTGSQPNPTAITYTTSKGPITIQFGPPQLKPPKQPTQYVAKCAPPKSVINSKAETASEKQSLPPVRAATYEKNQSKPSYLKFANPDPAFLQPPSCVLCDDPSFKQAHPNGCKPEEVPPGANSSKNVCLYINRRLTQHWLQYKTNPFDVPSGAISLGHYQREYVGLVRREYYFYVLGNNEEETLQALNSFYEFSLFVLEATATNATSSTPVFIAGATLQPSR